MKLITYDFWYFFCFDSTEFLRKLRDVKAHLDAKTSHGTIAV